MKTKKQLGNFINEIDEAQQKASILSSVSFMRALLFEIAIIKLT